MATTFWMASFSTRPKSSTGAFAPIARLQVRRSQPCVQPDSPTPERNAVSSDTSQSRPPEPNTKTASGSESENPVIASPEPKANAPLRNLDWWPDQIDVSKLPPHVAQANPLGEDFDYAEEFAKLDVEALKADVFSVMTTSQDWWPADYGHYGGLFIRSRLRAAGT